MEGVPEPPIQTTMFSRVRWMQSLKIKVISFLLIINLNSIGYYIFFGETSLLSEQLNTNNHLYFCDKMLTHMIYIDFKRSLNISFHVTIPIAKFN